jgi:hypothetical protein
MVHERDLYWKCRIHRVVDFRDERNKALIATVQGKSDLGEILVKGVMDDRYKAYGAHDDRLTHSISRDSVSTLLTNAGISETSGRRIEKFLVKQDWLYLWPEKKLVSRIICIAPLLESIETDGTTKDVPLFWLYYSSVRPYLRDYRLPLVDGSPHNLDELFEQWKFNSTIRSVQKYEPLELMNYLTPAKREYMLSRD